MFGMLVATNLPLTHNTWHVWVNYMLHSSDEDMSLRKGALVYCTTGAVAAASSSRFTVSQSEIKKIKSVFENPTRYDKLTIEGKTYCIKNASNSQIVAFSGHKYFIISHSRSMIVIALCDSKSKIGNAAQWINKIASKLARKNY